MGGGQASAISFSPFGADGSFQFNAKTPRWLNALRSTIWLAARSLMRR
jgi:hypothetical protein